MYKNEKFDLQNRLKLFKKSLKYNILCFHKLFKKFHEYMRTENASYKIV